MDLGGILGLLFVLLVNVHQIPASVPRSRVRRVIGGVEVEEGKWPWLVSLQGKVPDYTIFGIPITYRKIYCGASLLNDRWVLTAAHCFTENGLGERALQPRYWHARMGDIELKPGVIDRVKDLVGELFDVNRLRDWNLHAEKVIIHPQYDANDLWANDIALLKLEEDVPSGEELLPHIQSVLLPEQGMMSFPATGQNCTMKGWGCTAGGGSVSDTAREVVLPKVSDTTCRNFWGTSVTTRLCAGYNLAEKGICSGDSGGPLVCQAGDKWIQVGIASFTSANRPGHVPGVFTRTSQFVMWIRETIANN